MRGVNWFILYQVKCFYLTWCDKQCVHVCWRLCFTSAEDNVCWLFFFFNSVTETERDFLSTIHLWSVNELLKFWGWARFFSCFSKSFHHSLHTVSPVDCVVKAVFIRLQTALWRIPKWIDPLGGKTGAYSLVSALLGLIHMSPLHNICTDTWNVTASQIWASFLSSMSLLKEMHGKPSCCPPAFCP